MKIKSGNGIAQVWADVIIDELTRQGCRDFFLCPGSRSTPLTLAVAGNKRAAVHPHFDERANSFRALGCAVGSKRPVVVITTSGSAVANLFPAVVEMSKKKIPVILLSADRPPELQWTGANQTIDQDRIFGNYVRWYGPLPVPTQDIPLRYVLTTIDQAMWRTQGEIPGPVHLNCPFREPFEVPDAKDNIQDSEIKSWLTSRQPYTVYTKSALSADINFSDAINRMRKIKTGVITVGKLSTNEDRKAVLDLAHKLHWPIFPDITSGLRLGVDDPHVIAYFDAILSSSDVRSTLSIDGVIQFGGRMTSKRYYEWLSNQSLKDYVMVLGHPLRNDPTHQVTCRIQASTQVAAKAISQGLAKRKSSRQLKILKTWNKQVYQLMDQQVYGTSKFHEAQVIRKISEMIPKDHALFVGSSLPIREWDTFASVTGPNIPVSSNRGASGIDGTLSTAFGVGQGLGRPTTLVIGDLALLYDLNALSFSRSAKNPLHIVVLNNDGGGIFKFLPHVRDVKDVEHLFTTPHGFRFEHAAKMFGLSYRVTSRLSEFEAVYKRFLASNESTLIEVVIDKEDNVRFQSKFFSLLKRSLKT